MHRHRSERVGLAHELQAGRDTKHIGGVVGGFRDALICSSLAKYTTMPISKGSQKRAKKTPFTGGATVCEIKGRCERARALHAVPRAGDGGVCGRVCRAACTDTSGEDESEGKRGDAGSEGGCTPRHTARHRAAEPAPWTSAELLPPDPPRRWPGSQRYIRSLNGKRVGVGLSRPSRAVTGRCLPRGRLARGDPSKSPAAGHHPSTPHPEVARRPTTPIARAAPLHVHVGGRVRNSPGSCDAIIRPVLSDGVVMGHG